MTVQILKANAYALGDTSMASVACLLFHVLEAMGNKPMQRYWIFYKHAICEAGVK